jgi:hypothetical protein
MIDLRTSITQKNQLEALKLERQKLIIESNNLNREIMEITNSINVIRRSRTYLKGEEVRVVALKEYSQMMNTLVRLEKDRSLKKEEYKKKKEDLEAKTRQSKSLESIIGRYGDLSNTLIFPPRGIFLKEANGSN